MTAQRSIPYFKEQVIPHLRAGRHVFIAAHGNSLRSIIMYIDKLTAEEVVRLELATGEPLIYNFESETFSKD
jgi:2,3-bisphosphoglycerate-dependent phosphoglycerate mutase